MPRRDKSPTLREYDRIVKHNGVAFANKWLAAKRDGSRALVPARGRPRAARIGPSEKFGGVSAVIDACCVRWADLLADPFNSNDLCGLPTGSTQASQKVKVWIKTSLTTGSTPNSGGFAWAPQAMVASDPGSGTDAALVVTNTSYTTNLVPSNGDTGTALVNSNAPYATASFGTTFGDIQARVVLAAIRVTSATTKLNEGASFMAYTDPSHAGVEGLSAANIMAHDNTHNIVMMNGRPNTLVWIPRSYTSEVEYSGSVDLTKSVGGLVVDPSTTVTKCNVEAVAIVEYIGDGARGKTDSMSSSQGDQFLDRAHSLYKAGVAVVNGAARGYQAARDFHDHLVRQGYIQSPVPLRQRRIEL